MTFEEIKSPFYMEDGNGTRYFSRTRMAHWFSLRIKVVEEWEANNKVPDTYVEHVKDRLTQLDDYLTKR